MSNHSPQAQPGHVHPQRQLLGYLHCPPIWFDSAPSQLGEALLAAPALCTHNFKNGLRISAYREGMFVFDATNWPPGAPIAVPVHDPARPMSTAVREATKLNKERMANVVFAMNAHLACLYSSVYSEQKKILIRYHPIITIKNLLKIDDTSGVRLISDITQSTEPLHIFANDIFFGRTNIVRGAVFTLPTIHNSFNMLDQVLSYEDLDILYIFQILYMAHLLLINNDGSTSLILAWTICENLLRRVWDRYLDEHSEVTLPDGKKIKVINSDRRKKLKSRDYSASVMLEVLSLSGALTPDTYEWVDKVRGKRNRWLHFMEQIATADAHFALFVCAHFLAEVTKIKLSLPSQ
jgi:hypothetical protein